MKKMKKVWLPLLGLTLAVALTGCGSKEPATPATDATASADAIVMKLAHDQPTSSPFHKSSEYFKQEVESKSEGRIKVEIYPAMQLGTNREQIEGQQMGTIEAVLTPTAKYGGFAASLNVIDMPFIFPNEDIMWQVMEGDIGKEAMAPLEEIGIKGVAYVAEGWKWLTANKAIHTPDDYKGLKIRTMETPIIMAQFKSWGANPVPIDFSELYNSLQQKVVDGQENPIITNHDMKFYEVQKYMTNSRHAYLSYFLSFSKQWFDGLEPDLQDIVYQAGLDMAQYQKTLMAETNETYLQEMLDSGLTEAVELTEEERDAFRAASEPVYTECRDLVGGELLDKTRALVTELEAQAK